MLPMLLPAGAELIDVLRLSTSIMADRYKLTEWSLVASQNSAACFGISTCQVSRFAHRYSGCSSSAVSAFFHEGGAQMGLELVAVRGVYGRGIGTRAVQEDFTIF